MPYCCYVIYVLELTFARAIAAISVYSKRSERCAKFARYRVFCDLEWEGKSIACYCVVMGEEMLSHCELLFHFYDTCWQGA